MCQRQLLALFDKVEDAEAAIIEIRNTDLKGFNTVNDMMIQSPIELPEVEELLGEKSVYVQWFTLVGAILGGLLGFWLIAGSQSNFYAQMKGGKPIVPIPPDLVLTYEMFILGGIFFTVVGFLICAGLPEKRSSLYSSNVSVEQIGVLVKGENETLGTLKAIFIEHHAFEIQEETERK